VGVGEHEVVPIARSVARKRPVVEPEQADDPVGHRAHRHQRADGQVAGAEVRSGRSALEALGEQDSDLGEREGRRVHRAVDSGFGDDVVE
jgi:hypothetical protein